MESSAHSRQVRLLSLRQQRYRRPLAGSCGKNPSEACGKKRGLSLVPEVERAEQRDLGRLPHRRDVGEGAPPQQARCSGGSARDGTPSQLVERLDDDIGQCERIERGWVTSVRDRDDAHAGRVGRADPVAGVLDRRAPSGFDTEATRRFEEDVRCRFAPFDLLSTRPSRRRVRKAPSSRAPRRLVASSRTTRRRVGTPLPARVPPRPHPRSKEAPGRSGTASGGRPRR